MLRRRARGQAGFVITLELVLIFTILGIGLLVGLVAIRNALFKWFVNKQAQTVWVYDSSDPAKVLGPVRDFDEHEAPRLFYIDRNVTWQDSRGDPFTANFRAFVGVRGDRFTGRQRIFYENPDCSGLVCIQGAGVQSPDSRLVGDVVDETTPGAPLPTFDRVDRAGGVGYLYALQQGPTYGIGRDLGTGNQPGTLYRQTNVACAALALTSVWESQSVGASCVVRTIDPLAIPTLFGAIPVEDSVGNFVFAQYTPPFRVNMPPDASAWVSTPPTGEQP